MTDIYGSGTVLSTASSLSRGGRALRCDTERCALLAGIRRLFMPCRNFSVPRAGVDGSPARYLVGRRPLRTQTSEPLVAPRHARAAGRTHCLTKDREMLGGAAIERSQLHPATSTRPAGLQRRGSQRAKRAITETGCIWIDWSS